MMTARGSLLLRWFVGCFSLLLVRLVWFWFWFCLVLVGSVFRRFVGLGCCCPCGFGLVYLVGFGFGFGLVLVLVGWPKRKYETCL